MSRVETVSIIGGGYSAGRVDLGALPRPIIGVNDAGILAPHVDVIVSMDRLWTESRWAQLSKLCRASYIRRSAVQNIAERPGWLTLWDGDVRSAVLSIEPGVLNGANSGFCAFNLAYMMHPQRIILVGFDMSRGPNGEPYWYPAYPWAKPTGATSDGKYREWVDQFRQAKAQIGDIQVLCVGKRTPSFDVFPWFDPAEMPK